MEEEKPEKKVSEVEFILVLMILIIANIICAIMNFTVFLAPLASIINIPVFLGMQFYLRMKGMKPNKMLVGGAIEFIPIINALPVDIITWIMTVITENNPKLAGITKPKLAK